MSIVLRILLIVVSVFAGMYAVREIRKSQMKIENAIFWFVLAVVLIILSIFPGIVTWAAATIGVESPVNLIYLIMIFLLFYKAFSLSVKVAQLEHKVNILTAENAMADKKLRELDNEK
ncbi:MAG: DUF2304 domain-containing protein [Eubacterium sp.]|nr:DUF2304 domain-containing protein [Eubacterium sp.]